MFDIGPAEIVVLVVAAVLLFGPDKLPDLARKAARVLVYVRNIANNAQNQISSELGPGFENFDIRDPKGSIRRHLMDQVQPIMADVEQEIADSKKMFADTTEDLASVREELEAVRDDVAQMHNGRELHGSTAVSAASAEPGDTTEPEESTEPGDSTEPKASAPVEASDPGEASDTGEPDRPKVASTPFDTDAT